MKIALTIAGSDSIAGAGIQQDLKVFQAFGVYGASVLTAVTAQNTSGIQKIKVLDSEIVSEQIDSVLSDLKINAVKIGMLTNQEIADLVYKKINGCGIENLVLDPVMFSTSGTELLHKGALKPLKKLISEVKITTPNVREAEILSGIKIKGIEDAKLAAKKISQSMESGGCVVTCGDLKTNDRFTDVLYFNDNFYIFPLNDYQKI